MTQKRDAPDTNEKRATTRKLSSQALKSTERKPNMNLHNFITNKAVTI